jgi:hypothetical protein
LNSSYYNFIREHGSIKKTPAEQAGIKLDLGQNKIESLIKLASKHIGTPTARYIVTIFYYKLVRQVILRGY